MKKLILIIMSFLIFNIMSFSDNSTRIYFELENLRTEDSIILVINPKDGQIIESSNGAKAFYGYDNLKKMNITDINILSEKEVKAEMNKVSRGHKNYFHFRHKLANKNIRDVYVNSYRMFCNNNLVLVSTIRDVTEEVITARNADILRYSIITILLIAVISITLLFLKAFYSEKRYIELFENMLEAFALHEMIFDKDGNPVDYKFLSINPYFEKLTGLKKENIVGKTVKEALPGTEDYWIKAYGKVVKNKEPLYYENYSQELGKHFSCYAFSPYKNKFVVVFSDVTKEKRLQNELEAEKEKLQEQKERAEMLAVHDSLTNLPNRRLLQDRVENSILFAKRNKTKLAICVLDIDDFKQVNDKYGHLIGDEVLKLVAVRSKQSLREYDTISRIGGDEFVLLITNFISEEQCEHIVERLLISNNKVMKFDDLTVQTTFSIGVALYPEHGSTYKELVKNADTALYEAKRNGKNKCLFYNNDFDYKSTTHAASGRGMV